MTAPARLVERNRRNAQLSTGPRTAEGKAISRANSVKHGFCANPAAGVVEDPGEFDALLAELNERIWPTNPVEEGLAHRIGVCLWRLQRAARIDAAMTDVSVVAAAPGPKDISVWIDRIDLLFQPIYTVEHDPAKRPSWLPSGEKWCTFKRPGLVELDRMREPDGEIWQDGAAIAAMVTMLENLRDAVAGPWLVTSFTPYDAQKLAWLLGDCAARYGYLDGGPGHRGDGFYYPDDQAWRSEIDDLIGKARKRGSGSQPAFGLPPELTSLIEAQLTILRQRQHTCGDPFSCEQATRKKIAAMLPEAQVLDRLLRYLQVTDEHFRQAAQNAAQKPHENSRTDTNPAHAELIERDANSDDCENLQEMTTPCELQGAVGDGRNCPNLEPLLAVQPYVIAFLRPPEPCILRFSRMMRASV